MDRTPYILVFRFQKKNDSDKRYNHLLNKLNSFVDEFQDAEKDYSTSTRLLYTDNNLENIWNDLLARLYTDDVPYEEGDMIVIFQATNTGDGKPDLVVSLLTEKDGKPAYETSHFVDYFEQIREKNEEEQHRDEVIEQIKQDQAENEI